MFLRRASATGIACLLLGIALQFLCLPAFASKDTVPDWVRAAAAAKEPIYSAETSAVVLLDETTLTVGPDGKAVEHRRRVVKILRPAGREEGMVEVPFDKDQKILSLHVWSIGPDGHEYAVKDSELTDFGYPGEGSMYSDLQMRAARAPGRDPGGIVAYEYDRRARPYVHEATWFFQDDVPVLKQSFTLELPPGYSYGTVWAHHGLQKDQEKGIDLERQRYRWELADTPEIDLEHIPMRPALGSLAGRMTIHYAPTDQATALASWRGIGEWYDQIARDRLAATPALSAKANELTAGKTDFYAKAEAIAEFVQKEIRYFVIEMRIGGYQPHPAAEILQNGYGDCKDKAALLTTMLSTVGIHSALMMVDSERGVIDPDAPSIVGNHMITAIEIPKGTDLAKLHSTIVSKAGRLYLIFDPTSEKTPFGQLESGLQGGYGVLLEGKDSEIAELPVLAPELNTIRRAAVFQLHADGVLTGNVVEKRFGDLAEYSRYLYTQGDVKQQQTSLDKRLSRDFTTVEVKDVKVENAGALNKDMTTTFNLTADRYARTAGPLLMVRPRVLGTEGLRVDQKVRHVPIDLSETRTVQDDFTIELPEGYVVDELPDPVKLDLGFASYTSSSMLTGTAMHYTRTFTVRNVSLPPERYGDVQKLALAIEADEQGRAVLKKK